VTWLTLLVLLAARDDTAQAGTAYREAVDAVNQARYEDAVAKLQEAIRFEPRETERLQYRDKEGRQLHAYHPHFVWSQARVLQARAEKSPARQRQLYREAITHLDLTSHPQAAALLDTAKKELTEVEKLAPPPTADTLVDAVRREVGELCDQERFVDALRLIPLKKDVLDPVPGSDARLIEMIQGHRKTVLDRYERNLSLGLETIAVTPPLEKLESVPLLLLPTLPPATVIEKPEGRFAWLQEFLALYQKELALLRNPAAATLEDLQRSAREFEQSACAALAAGSLPGFRAALNVGHSLRTSRLRELSSGRDDVALGRLLTDSDQSLRELRKALPEKEGGVLAPFAERLRAAREGLQLRDAGRARLQAWPGRAEQAFGPAMADPDALKALAREASALQDHPAWPAAPAGTRARVLFDSAVIEAIAALLDGDALSGLPEQTSSKLRAASRLDPAVRAPWKGRLSPKLDAWIDSATR
jgi:tetratricopeptide (TPR) repeat protein